MVLKEFGGVGGVFSCEDVDSCGRGSRDEEIRKGEEGMGVSFVFELIFGIRWRGWVVFFFFVLEFCFFYYF